MSAYAYIEDNQVVIGNDYIERRFSTKNNRLTTTEIINKRIDGEKVLENHGEVQFTDYGLSGIPIMQLSRFVSMSPSEDIYINLDMTPGFSPKKIENRGMKLLNPDEFLLAD